MMVAMEEEDTVEVAAATAEVVEEALAAAGVEVVVVVVAMEDRAGKGRSFTFGYYSAGLARRHGDEDYSGLTL